MNRLDALALIPSDVRRTRPETSQRPPARPCGGNGKRQSLVIIRERNGNSLPMVFKSESAALSWIKSRLLSGTTLNADEAAGWDGVASKYEMRRINHQEAYSDGEACTNQAESYFSRLRRAEMGHHHHVSGPYLLRYAQESAWREDARRVDNGSQVRRVAHLALHRGPSVDISGYLSAPY